MRMILLPVILTLSACATLPEATEGKTYFNYPRQCEGCEKNDIDRYGDRSRP